MVCRLCFSVFVALFEWALDRTPYRPERRAMLHRRHCLRTLTLTLTLALALALSRSLSLSFSFSTILRRRDIVPGCSCMGHHAELRLGEVVSVASAFGSTWGKQVARPHPPRLGLLLRLFAIETSFKPAPGSCRLPGHAIALHGPRPPSFPTRVG